MIINLIPTDTTITPPDATKKWSLVERYIPDDLSSGSVIKEVQWRSSELKVDIYKILRKVDESFIVQDRNEYNATTDISPIIDNYEPRFLNSLLQAFDENPLEDGYNHPGEDIIRDALSEQKQVFINWLNYFIESEPNSSNVASVLRCVGRMEAEEGESWGLELMRQALLHPEVEVRDAAVQAIEAWENPEAVRILTKHQDEVPWLQEYVERVKSDLMK